MRRQLLPADVVITAYFAALTVLTLLFWTRMQHPARFVGIHALFAAGAWITAWADARLATPKWRLLHYWYPMLAVPGAFRELQDFIPEIHPFGDHAWDLALAALDARWFGDARGFLRAMQWGPFTDAMHACYWSYFLIPIALGIALFRRGELGRFREVVTVFLVGWFLSYLGYILIPAVGPHHAIDGARDLALDGLFIGRPLHRFLMTIEGEMPDAFPSGHALIAMLALIQAWRHDRKMFAWLCPFATGLVIATTFLRYHYVVDVAASVALVPVVLLGGRWINRAWSGSPEVPKSGSPDAARSGSPTP